MVVPSGSEAPNAPLTGAALRAASDFGFPKNVHRIHTRNKRSDAFLRLVSCVVQRHFRDVVSGMTLKKIDVAEVGLVRYATEHGTMVRVTVECPARKTAVYFEVKPVMAPRAGEWIHVEGFGKVDTRKGDGQEPVLLHDGYMHDPHDGTPATDWTFLGLREFSWRHVPPGPLAGQMARVKERVDTHLSAWTVTRDSKSLATTISVVEELRETLIQAAVLARADEEAKAAKPAAIDIDV